MTSLRFFSILMLFLFVFSIFSGSIPCLYEKSAYAQSERTPTISGIRIGTHPGKTRLVLEMSREVPFRAFALEDSPRLVVDMPTLVFRPELYPLSSPVKAARVGVLETGLSRLVFEIEKPSQILNAFFLPAQKGMPARLVLDFTEAPKAFNFASAPVFGSLKAGTTWDVRRDASSVQQAPVLPLKSARGLSTGENRSVKEEPFFDPNAAYSPAAAAKAQKTTGNWSEERTEEPPVYKAPSPSAQPEHRPMTKPVIVIDAGHGGQDPGALGANGSREKDVTLAVAKELARQLEATGRYKVHLTRSSDVFIKLHERVAIARRVKGELFISLHADSIDKRDVHGASIYTISDKASDAQTEKLAARENRADLIAGVDLSHEDKDVANILIDLTMRDTMNQSKFFANTMVRQADSDGLDLLERPHRYAGFAVLKAPDIPSVLIEMGYMSNPSEVSKLTSNAYRRRIAQSILAGVNSYFQKMEKVAEK